MLLEASSGSACRKTGFLRKLLQRAKQIKRERLLQREKMCSDTIVVLPVAFAFTLKESVGKEHELQEEFLD